MLLTPSQQSFSGSEQGLEFYPLCVDLIGTSIFVVVGTFHGRQVRVLIDTGAGLSFISEDLCRDLELTMTPCLDKMIKLGNAGTCSVDKMIKANITLSDLTLDFEPYQLTLPKGIDIIIGCPVLNQPDLWLQPATRTLRILKDQEEHVVNTMDAHDFMSELPTTVSIDSKEGVHALNYLEVDGETIQYDVEMVSRSSYKKLIILQDQDMLDWDSYTNSKIRGKNCAYASTIAKDRADFVDARTEAPKARAKSQEITGAMLLVVDDQDRCLLTLDENKQYGLPHCDVQNKRRKKSGRRPVRDADKLLNEAAQHAATKLLSAGPGRVKMKTFANAGHNRIFAVAGALTMDAIEPSANAAFFALDELPKNMLRFDKILLTEPVSSEVDDEKRDKVYLCHVVLDPDMKRIAEEQHTSLFTGIGKIRGSNRSRQAAAAANDMFETLHRQTDLKIVRKDEHQRRCTRSLTNNLYIFDQSSSTKRSKKDFVAKSVQFLDDDAQAWRDEAVDILDQGMDLSEDQLHTLFAHVNARNSDKIPEDLELDYARMLAHGQIQAAIQHSDDWVETQRLQELHIDDFHVDPDWVALEHMVCAMNPKSKFSDNAEMPKLDSKSIDEYMKGKYPINLADIDATVPEQQEWVKDMLAGKFGKLSCFDPVEKYIDNPDHEKAHFETIPGRTPKKPHRHRCPVHLMEVLKAWHQDMYKRNFIKPIMDASHLSPVLVIKKPDTAEGKSRGYRFVVAMVEINDCLESCENFTPSGDEIFDRLRDAKFISTTDLTDGYWCCGLTDQTSRLCAFQSEFGSWCYRVLPQGAKPSAGIFSEWHSRILRRYGVLAGQEIFVDLDAEFERQIQAGDTNAAERGDKTHKKRVPEELKWRGDGFVEVMLDDALLHGISAEQHRRQLLHYLKVCSRERLPIKMAKCTWFTKYCRYLGIVAGNGLLLVDPLKIKAILKMVRPKNASELKGFLGATGWTRKWIPSFAARAKVLNSLLKKGTVFKDAWNDEHTAAWLGLKKCLMTYPVLRCFDKDLPVVIYTDASQFHCGGAAVQFYPDPGGSDKEVPAIIAYHSRTFNEAESKYSSQEREMAGVVSCTQAFRHYLINSRFRVRCVSDHESLKYAQLNKIQANRIGRWTMKMSEFNYFIEYAKGATHHMADVLSRAIEEPDSAWKKRAPIDNDDDFLSTPFMAFWPQVQYQYQCAMLCADMEQSERGVKSVPPGSTNTITPDSTKPSTNKATETTVLASSLEYSTDYDEELDNPDRYLAPHEKILFGFMSQKPTPTRKIFREIDYLRCKDFGQIYRYLVDSDPDQRQALRTALHRIDGDVKLVSKHNEKDLLQVVKHYHIDCGYLYKSDRNHGHVLCVPDAMQAHHDMKYSDGLQKKISLRRLLFEECHSTPCAGHRGIGATELTLSRRYYWPHMRNHRRVAAKDGNHRHEDSVTELVRRCPTCSMAKIDRNKPQGLLQPVQVPVAPAQSYNADLIVGLPAINCEGGDFSKVLVVVDRFSTWVRLIPALTNVTATLLGEMFTEEIILKAGRGIPLEIVSDRDPLMTSGFWRGLFKRLGTVLKFTAARNQQANGLAERTIATVADLLRTNINFNQRNWMELLPHIEFVLNATMKNSLGGHCPMMAEMGIQPLLPVDLVARLRGTDFEDGLKYQGRGNHSDPQDRIASLVNLRGDIRTAMQEVREAMTVYADRRRRNPDEDIQVGSHVWLTVEGLSFSTINNKGATKLKPRRYGPFEVLEQVSTNSFKLDIGDEATDTGVHGVFPVRLLRPCNQDPGRSSPSIPIPGNDVETPYEVAEVLAERANNKWSPPREYLITWKGYSARHGRTWEPESELFHDAFDTLEDFVSKNGSDLAKEAIKTQRSRLNKSKAQTKAGRKKKK